MKPKLAYVDHMPLKSFLETLAKAGIDFKPYRSISEFQKENDFCNFPVFLCHPGLYHQAEFSKIVKEYPNLKSAMITDWDYEYCESEIPIFTYNQPENVINWILENQ